MVFIYYLLLFQVHRLERVCSRCWSNAYKSVRRHAELDQSRQALQSESAIENIGNLEIPSTSSINVVEISTSVSVVSVPTPPPLPPSALLNPPSQAIVRNPRIISRIYKRAAASSRHCIFSECYSDERLLVPSAIKEMLLLHYRLYVPRSARICSHHLYNGAWNELSFHNNDFTGMQMDDMMLIMERGTRRQFDFSNIRELDPHLCHYWLGMDADSFHQLLLYVPQLSQVVPCASTALSIILVKLRTGDSNERLSSLFNLSRRTLERYMSHARNCLTETFVPLYLGLGHMSIQDVAARNKIIPEGLFGNPEMSANNKPAITICDGTYIYVQSSSNYSYQKKTYSLHKLNNLVKPFLIVCCDGYILQSLGPFPATENDANIMSKEFRSERSPLRTYFRPNDIFILDRGFRDVVGELQRYGYKAHMPESLLEGENQLTTEQANRSRCVTMCRWVVEVVNGRIKRDFKLFRQEYFNRASTHLMTDFNIACALLNKYHIPIQDRPDARQLLAVALAKINTTNHLGAFIRNENINRRRTIFRRIDAEHPHLNTFPKLSLHDLIMIALGTYQIKQSRSYYGEHVRNEGKYEIEVAIDIEDELPLVLGTDKYLVRGRIRSRHIGNKVYYAYILVNSHTTNHISDIAGYYCNCLVGNRTVGCCVHVMTVLWYLSWARYRSINAPAQFLDDMFYEYVNYDEEEAE